MKLSSSNYILWQNMQLVFVSANNDAHVTFYIRNKEVIIRVHHLIEWSDGYATSVLPL